MKMPSGLQESDVVSVEKCLKLEATDIGTNPEILERHTSDRNRTLC